MPIDSADVAEWLARLEQTIEDYRADQRRQILQQLAKFRRLADVQRSRVPAQDPRAH